MCFWNDSELESKINDKCFLRKRRGLIWEYIWIMLQSSYWITTQHK